MMMMMVLKSESPREVRGKTQRSFVILLFSKENESSISQLEVGTSSAHVDPYVLSFCAFLCFQKTYYVLLLHHPFRVFFTNWNKNRPSVCKHDYHKTYTWIGAKGNQLNLKAKYMAASQPVMRGSFVVETANMDSHQWHWQRTGKLLR